MALQKWLLIVVFTLVAPVFSMAEDRYDPGEKSTKDSFRVLNWNALEMGRNNKYPFARVREVLLSQRPDFVTLQEVKSCDRGFYYLLRADIDFADEAMLCAQSQLYPGRGEGAAGSYGVGIASLMTPQSDKVFREIHGRTVLGARYLFKEQYFWLWTAHAAFVTGPRDNRRKEDFENIADMINRYSAYEPVILTGDFNANRDDPWGGKDPERGDMDVFFNGGFVDVWRQLYPDTALDPGYTWQNDRRIDYVLVKNMPPGWEVTKMELSVMDNIWCTIQLDNDSRPLDCAPNQALDHNPLLLQVNTAPAD